MSRSVTVHTAAAEVGQGVGDGAWPQIAPDRAGRRAWWSSRRPTPRSARPAPPRASRQTYMTGGAVQAACAAVRATVLDRPAAPTRVAGGRRGGRLRRLGGRVAGRPLLGRRGRGDRRVTTTPPHAAATRRPGRATPTWSFAFAAHRAVVDVDAELGPRAGGRDRHRAGRRQGHQPAGGESARSRAASRRASAWRVMEEIQVVDGLIRNPSFTDYLIPTVLDMPPVAVDVLEQRRPGRALRPARRRRATDHLLDPGGGGGPPRGDRPGPDPRPGAPGPHRARMKPDDCRSRPTGTRSAPRPRRRRVERSPPGRRVRTPALCTHVVPADRFNPSVVGVWGRGSAVRPGHGAGPCRFPRNWGPGPGQADREPIEDLRIDFEDGYGVRGDETRRMRRRSRPVRAVGALMPAPPFLGLRIKSLGGAYPPARRPHARPLPLRARRAAAGGFRGDGPEGERARPAHREGVSCAG